ncbi:MAG: chromate efflux transporter [Alteraurantiacibacter sp.]
MTPEPAAPPTISLTALFLKFLRFGCLAFGGPVAQIAMIRQALVAEERWIEPARFNRLLAVMQVLPGPEAHELCVHMGIIARGRPGGLLAGLGFMLPGLVLMIGCAMAYQALVAGHALLDGVLLGVQVAVLAVIARAVQRIGGHILTDSWLWTLAVLAALATLARVPFWMPLVVAGLANARAEHPLVATIIAALALVTAWLVMPQTSLLPISSGASEVALVALFIAGLKGGLLTFGGAYTAIPYVRADTVGRGWLGDGQFLDGVAFANVLPAPLVIFATFTGYIVAGLPGALAITAGMFLPAFAFSLIFFERLESVVENPRLHRVLDGVAAAVVGIIACTLLQLGWTAWLRLGDSTQAPWLAPWLGGLIFLGALVAAVRLKSTWVAPAIIAAGGAVGWLVF